MSDPIKALLCRVTGRVQGVCFRHYTKHEAHKLGVTGWVKNCADGAVEALICGTDTQINAMQAWLAHGPDMARVDTMHAQEISLESCPDTFQITW
ncbi:MAG: acylphosphatase [Mariprofundaceae bacterium]